MTEKAPWRILLIDDNQEEYFLLCAMLKEVQSPRIQVEWARSVDEGQAALEGRIFDAVLVDHIMGAFSGIEFIWKNSGPGIQVPLILFSGKGDFAIDAEAMEAGATLYLGKDEATPLVLERSIRYAIERKQAEKALSETNGLLLARQQEVEQLKSKLELLSQEFQNQNEALNAQREELQSQNEELRAGQDELQQIQTALQESEARFRTILKNVPVTLAAQDRNLRFFWAYNQRSVNPASVVGKTDTDLFPPADAARLMALKRRAIETETEIRDQFWLVSGSMRFYLDLYIEPLRDSTGQVIGIGITTVDLTQMKLAEEALLNSQAQLQENAIHLEQLNRDLQDFAFIASHDLQEPLRKVKAFGTLLKEKAGPKLSDEERDYIQRMNSAASRMQVMIDDLLNYSRLSTEAQTFKMVNLGQIAHEVLSDLEVRVGQVHGEVEIGDLPTIEADALQMRQLLQNLISNALKFHRRDVPPLVRVYAKKTDPGSGPPQVTLVVEDNGIGFDNSHVTRLFLPFQRLVARSEYEGTGIGLAICRKIVEHHQGKITAVGRPGQGACFTVTLPVRLKRSIEITEG
jgi:PAS domain S-box-containing protein